MRLALGIICTTTFLSVILFSSAKPRFKHRYRTSTSKIEGFVSIKDYPYIVGLIKMYLRYPQQFCAGTIIAETFVLTPAHCIYPRRVQHAITIGKVVVRGGATNIRGSTGYDHRIYGYTIHTQYNESGYQNDIALIKVKDPLTNLFEYPITYVTKEYKYPPRDAIILGWGRTDVNGIALDKLRADKMTIVKNCFDYRIQDIPGRVCAVRSNVCTGDNGGPVVNSNNSLIGMMSWYKSCTPDTGVSLTRVGYYDDWISQNMKNVPSVD